MARRDRAAQNLKAVTMTNTTISLRTTGPDGTTIDTGPVDLATMRAALTSVKGRPRTKPDASFDAAADTAFSAAAAELRQFIERWEQLQAEKQDIADAQKEVMAEAKGFGYETKILRKIIALRKRDKDDIAEEEAILEMYKSALGMD